MNSDHFENKFIETIKSQKIGNFFTLNIEKHQLANGKVFDYHVFHIQPFAVIIPKFEEKYMLIKQYRPSWRKSVLEFPAGVANSFDEPAEEIARRELKEETGYYSDNLTLLGTFQHSSRSTQLCYSYLAEDLVFKGQDLDDEEYIEDTVLVTENEIEQLINDGQIVDISHIATFYRYLAVKHHLE